MSGASREPSRPETVAFFGGSFDPPHVGHVLAAVYVLSTGQAERVLVAPVAEHAFGKCLAPFAERLRLCELAFGWLPAVTVSSVEAELPGPNFTLRTLEHLASEHPNWSLRLLVGADVLEARASWHRFDDVCALAPPIALGRVGHVAPDAEAAPLLPEVSSTEVRAWLARRAEPEARRALARFVPQAVLAAIEERGLYA